MNMPEAKKLVELAKPNRVVRQGLDYSKDAYIFEATKAGNQIDNTDSFFKVNKNSGQIEIVSPLTVPNLVMRFLEDGVTYPSK